MLCCALGHHSIVTSKSDEASALPDSIPRYVLHGQTLVDKTESILESVESMLADILSQ